MQARCLAHSQPGRGEQRKTAPDSAGVTEMAGRRFAMPCSSRSRPTTPQAPGR